jgi:hypothetical protein
MKMIFFSPDRIEVEMLSKQLTEAGIACEVRGGGDRPDAPVAPPEAEIWVKRGDCHDAFMLCVKREAGFAKRAAPALTIEDLCTQQIAA